MSSDKATYSMILCTLLSERMKSRGITQQEFLMKAGIATGTWSRIMRGMAHFGIEDIRAACEVLNWTVSDLTAKADELGAKLEKKEHVEVVTKDGLKSNDSNAGAFIAGAALAFLLTRL